MSKGAKKTGGARVRKERKELGRVSRELSEKKTLLVVGEGKETEPNYFEGIRKNPTVRKNYVLAIKKVKVERKKGL